MNKTLLFLALISSSLFASAQSQDAIQFCSRLGALTAQISREQSDGNTHSAEASKTYKSLAFLDSSNPKIRQSMLQLIKSSEGHMSHSTQGSFYTHACLYNYSDDYTLIEKLSPVVGLHCDESKGEPACLNKVLSAFK